MKNNTETVWDRRWERVWYREKPEVNYNKHFTKIKDPSDKSRSHDLLAQQAREEVAVMDALIRGEQTIEDLTSATELNPKIVAATLRRLKGLVFAPQPGYWGLLPLDHVA